MRIGSAAPRCRGRDPSAGFFSAKLSSHPNPRELHPGKRNFAPGDFGQNRRLIEPGDRPIALGDSTLPRQPAELSGFFKPRGVLPVRGDWLVVDAVRVNRSLQVKLPANRENNRELFIFGLFSGILAQRSVLNDQCRPV
jgi:hypothetical protein